MIKYFLKQNKKRNNFVYKLILHQQFLFPYDVIIVFVSNKNFSIRNNEQLSYSYNISITNTNNTLSLKKNIIKILITIKLLIMMMLKCYFFWLYLSYCTSV